MFPSHLGSYTFWGHIFPCDLFESCMVSTRGCDVTSDHVYTTWSLYRAAAEVTGKHWADVLSTETV